MTKKFFSTFNFIALIIFVAIFALACKSKQNPALSLSENEIVAENKTDAKLYISEPIYNDSEEFGKDIFKIENGKIWAARIEKINWYDTEEGLRANFAKNPVWDIEYAINSFAYSIKSQNYKTDAVLTMPADGKTGKIKYGNGLNAQLKSEITLTRDARLGADKNLYISDNVYVNDRFGKDIFKIENGKIRAARIQKTNWYDTEDELIANFIKNPVWEIEYTIGEVSYSIKSQNKTDATLTISADGNTGKIKYGNGLNTQLFKSEITLTRVEKL